VFEPTKSRIRAGPARHNEDLYSWLDRSSRPAAQAARQLINDWFSHIPTETTTAHLRGRLESNDDSQFAAAFWELYLHERIRKLGWNIQTDVPVRDTGLTIDFLASRPGRRLYLEATSLDQPKADIAQRRREAQVYDVLDGLNSPWFFLWAQKRRTGASQPRLAGLRAKLERWLNGLDLYRLRAAANSGQIDRLPTYVWRDGDWEYEFKALPKFAAAGKSGIRVLGSPGGAQHLVPITAEAIRDAISNKVKKYGNLDAELVVALMIDSPAHDEEDTADCLYGQSRAYGQSSVILPEGSMLRDRDGLWSRFEKKRLYGVVVTCQWNPWKVGSVWPLLWLRPGADHAMGQDLGFPMRFLAADGVTVNSLPAPQAPHEVFRLPSGWPPRP